MTPVTRIATALALLCPAAVAGAAPGFTSASGITTTGEGAVSAITPLADGSSLISGYFGGIATFSGTTLTSAGQTDGFVAKRNANGSYAWARRFGGTGWDGIDSADVAADGSLVVLGYLGSGPRATTFVTKLTATGTTVWSSDVWAPGDPAGSHPATPLAVVATADGGAALTGTGFGDNAGGYAVNFGSLTGPVVSQQITGTDLRAWVARVDSSGAFQWAVAVRGGISTDTDAVAQLPDGSLAFGGTIVGTAQIGSASATSVGPPGNGNGYVARAAMADGTVTAVTPIPSTVSSSITSVTPAPAGRLLLTGSLAGVTHFPGATTITRDVDNAFVALQAPDGAFDWSSAVDSALGSYAYRAAVRADGSALIAGEGNGTNTFGGLSFTSNSDDGDGFVAGVSPTGQFRWVAHGGTSPHGETYFPALGARADGSALAGGSISAGAGNATFGPSTVIGSIFQTGVVASVLDVPVTPAAPTARAGEERATVSITPIAGAAITGYTVTASPGGRTCTVAPTGTECTVTGLAARVAHTFTATAGNGAGSSPESAASAAVVPTAAPTPAPPPPPTRLRATVKCTGVRCVTTGPLPAGATRVTQSATTGARSNAVAQPFARKSAKGRCTLSPARVRGKKVKKRTYTCRITLAKGIWRVTTTAFKGNASVATTTRSVTVKTRAAR